MPWQWGFSKEAFWSHYIKRGPLKKWTERSLKFHFEITRVGVASNTSRDWNLWGETKVFYPYLLRSLCIWIYLTYYLGIGTFFANFPAFLLVTNGNCLKLYRWPSTNKNTGKLAKKDINQIQILYISTLIFLFLFLSQGLIQLLTYQVRLKPQTNGWCS